MSQIILFTPKHGLTAQQNLHDFIALARDHLTLWSNLEGFDWSANIWPTNEQSIRFTIFEYARLHHRKPLEPQHLMPFTFIEVAKAYLRYRHTVGSTKEIGREVHALRVIEFVLRQDMGIPDITKFNQRHWDMATSAVENYASRQEICNVMLSILKMLTEFLILTVDASFWNNPYRGKSGYDAINGTRAPADVKARKLPNQDALLAIAEVFSRHTSETQEDTHVMVSCITALLLSAPMRIGETLRFRTDCLRDENDNNGKTQYYLAYWVPKAQKFTRKAIPTTMAEVTMTAIERLREITEEGRKLARYMETNPTKFYRHANCPNVPDDQELKPSQVLQALGYNHKNDSAHFLRKHTGSCRLAGHTLDTLWQMVLVDHQVCNPHFPYQLAPTSSSHPPLKMSESLLCFRRCQLTTRPMTSPVILTPFYGDLYNIRFSDVESINFFSQNGYNPIKFNSHSLRHLLNRLGRTSGLSIETLTEWSSRATNKQTRTYLNDDPIIAASKGAALLGTAHEQQPLKPVTDGEAELYGQGPFHRSRYGICRRSWRAGPCNKFADCLNCSELLMCKGDKIAADIIKQDRDNLVLTYSAAKRAISDGERAASRWTEKAGPQIERLNQLLAVLHNPEIPDGSPVEMAGEDFSHEKMIISEKAEAIGVKLLDRKALRIEYGEELLACLELLRSSNNA